MLIGLTSPAFGGFVAAGRFVTSTERIDVEIPREQYDKIKSFVDEHKETRKDSNRYYGRAMAAMAVAYADAAQSNIEKCMTDYNEKKNHIKDVLKGARQ